MVRPGSSVALRFDTWVCSFTPHCLCHSDETRTITKQLVPSVPGEVKYPIQGVNV